MIHGSYIHSNGDVQEGPLVDDKFEGQTTITQHDGTVYTGGWSHEHAQGQGTKRFPDGHTVSGNWNSGRLPSRSGGAGNSNPYQPYPYPYSGNGCEDDPDCPGTSVTPGGDDGEYILKLTTQSPKTSPQ